MVFNVDFALIEAVTRIEYLLMAYWTNYHDINI
jgi:hypothetical protein